MHARAVRKSIAFGKPLAITLSLLATSGCREAARPQATPSAPTVRRLTLITPHNAKIREAFAQGFSEWRAAQQKSPVELVWIVRGTPQCVEYVDRLFTGTVDGRDALAPDLMFGGGVADHTALAAKGYCLELKLTGPTDRIPAEIHGIPTRGAKSEWFATGLSSFGLVYNQRDCELRGIAPPQSWSDLADPRFLGWMGVAAPEASGSNRQAMVFILQHEGWDRGWGTILRVLANSRAVLDSSSTVLDQVASGVFLAAFAVNSDGMARTDETGGRVVYVNPAGATAATPDISSVLKTTVDVNLATDFIEYCLSEAGQVIWSVRAEAMERTTGTLYHYPIDPAVYEKYDGKLAVSENPYKVDMGLRIDAQRADKLATALVPLVRAAAGENHILLQRAWAAVVAAGLPDDAVAELVSPPMNEAAALELANNFASADPARARELIAEVSGKFRERYQRVLDLVGQ